MKLLLIDSKAYDPEFINCRLPDVDYILFDYASDTYTTLIQKISEKGKFTDIALVQHGKPLVQLQIVLDEKGCIMNDVSPYPTFDKLKEFLQLLRILCGVQRFDFLACSLYNPTKMAALFTHLEQATGIDLRASTNFTGNGPDGDWILESDNVDVRQTYFTDEILSWNGVLYNSLGGRNWGGRTILRDISENIVYCHRDISGYPINPDYGYFMNNIKYPAGKIITWGQNIRGGDSSSVASDISAGIVSLLGQFDKFTAIRQDRRVIPWGRTDTTNLATYVNNLVDISYVYNAVDAQLCIKKDGSVVVWGVPEWGGNPSQTILNQLNNNIKYVTGSSMAFAVVTKSGSVIAWGDSANGGSTSLVASQLTSNVKYVYSSDFAFCALKGDGSIVAWGSSFYGGQLPTDRQISNVKCIYPSQYGFAALKHDGSVDSWGNASFGGGSMSAQTRSDLSRNVTFIASTVGAYAALRSDGSVISWGDESFGGTFSSLPGLTSGVVALYSSHVGFAALKSDGSVVSFTPNVNYGKYIDVSNVIHDLSANVIAIYSTIWSFAALRRDGSVVAWGNHGSDLSGVAQKLSSGVVTIVSTESAFAALKEDGSVVTWGNEFTGANSSSVADDISSGVIALFSTISAFAALKPSTNINIYDAYHNSSSRDIVPPTPTITSITPGLTSLTVNFTENQSLLYPTLSYTLIAQPTVTRSMLRSASTGEVTVTSSPATISGLTSDTPYVVTLQAVNDNGNSSRATGSAQTLASAPAPAPAPAPGPAPAPAPAPEPGQGVADPSPNNVSVILPIYFDVSGIDVSLFGQQVDMSGIIIKVNTPLSTSSLYDMYGSLISYRQDTQENIFEVDISQAKVLQLASDISSALYIVDGAQYDITKRGINNLDASRVFVSANTTFQQYNSIQDLIVSYFAEKILGHPGALSAISNDSSIRSSATQIFSETAFATKLASQSKNEGTMTDNDAKAIVQQVMNQDLARFNLVDKRTDGYTPLPFAAGDKIYVQMRMSNNTYSLKQAITNPSSITTGLLHAASYSIGAGSNNIPSDNDKYLLEFTLA